MAETSKEIAVTEPFLPPMEEYVELLKGVWERNWLTNQGPLVQRLERELQQMHGLDAPMLCVANGGLALQLSLKALGVSGEVITTPFSYVATASCPIWENCSLRFVDIENSFLTLDPAAVEAAITPNTEAILATHVFGNPCEVHALRRIAEKHAVALIYDAAHAFGVRYGTHSLLEYGDVSFVSLHATKVMHSVEGGAVNAKDPAVREKIEWMRRFGHQGQESFHGVGINAKMSEFHAAMGLCVLPYIDSIIRWRARISERYRLRLQGAQERCRLLGYREDVVGNYGYVPVLFETEALLLRVLLHLNERQVFPRRYFHPPLTCLTGDSLEALPSCNDLSKRIACLPVSYQLRMDEVDYICNVIVEVLNTPEI